jgi:hypothetical protein
MKNASVAIFAILDGGDGGNNNRPDEKGSTTVSVGFANTVGWVFTFSAVEHRTGKYEKQIAKIQ